MTAATSQQYALRTVETYDRIARDYDRVAPIASGLLLGLQADGLARALERIDVRPGERVLDLCCGTGALCQALAAGVLPHGDVTGVDLSRPMLDRARAKNRHQHVRFLEGNAELLPLSPDSFDRVCCTLTLHEMPPTVRRNVLREARRVARPYGRIYVVDWHMPDTLVRGLLLHLLILLAFRPEIRVDFICGGLVGEVTGAGFVVEDYATFAAGGLQLVVARKI